MLLKLLALLFVLQVCYAPPVTKNKEAEDSQEAGLEEYIEYHRYIREVVNTLESDVQFREKLEKANEEDIRSGKIAHQLEFVSHHLRTKLDEIKRAELERLRDLFAQKKALMGNDINDPMHSGGGDALHGHVNLANPHTFEIEDLQKLIAKTTLDLAEADKKRRVEFKQYELQKEYEKRDKLNHTTGEERTKLEKEFEEKEQKHKKHEKLHTPGHKQQLEEVWEEQDHMQQDFNPKTFFMLHDLDSNGLWDQEEVKALFIKELDKMYKEGAPEDDMRERYEEMERMREAAFNEMDTNKDGFITYEEFLQQTKRSDYEKDPGWEGLDEHRQYTDEEIDEYIRNQQMQHAPQQYHPNDINAPPGYYPPPPQGYQQPPPGAYVPPPHGGYAPPPHGGPVPQYQQHPAQMYPSGQQMHPQMGQGQGQLHPGQGQGQLHPGQGQGQPHPGQGQGQLHPGQMPQAQVNPQNIPRQANQPNLNTNEVYPNQNQQPNNQVPQQQAPVQQAPPQLNQQQGQTPPAQTQQQQPSQAQQPVQQQPPTNQNNGQKNIPHVQKV